ncbi:MAG: response regulator transcription factor [Anaerolineae bacterium]|nr:response regulator transcription factor [Anaerolineae bacterium]
MSEGRILVVDDEPRYLYLIRHNLEVRGYRVLTAETGREAIDAIVAQQPDLVVLDVRLPDIDGFAACQQIRTFSTVPVIMLTALSDHANRVRGLECGADDYLPKPFHIEELVARVHATLRRVAYDARGSAGSAIEVGRLRIDTADHCVTLEGRQVSLSPTEYQLLVALALEVGRVLVYDYLLDRVWGPGYAGNERLVHQGVSRIRRKIESDPGKPQYIHTAYGVGYLLQYTGPAP